MDGRTDEPTKGRANRTNEKKQNIRALGPTDKQTHELDYESKGFKSTREFCSALLFLCSARRLVHECEKSADVLTRPHASISTNSTHSGVRQMNISELLHLRVTDGRRLRMDGRHGSIMTQKCSNRRDKGRERYHSLIYPLTPQRSCSATPRWVPLRFALLCFTACRSAHELVYEWESGDVLTRPHASICAD